MAARRILVVDETPELEEDLAALLRFSTVPLGAREALGDDLDEVSAASRWRLPVELDVAAEAPAALQRVKDAALEGRPYSLVLLGQGQIEEGRDFARAVRQASPLTHSALCADDALLRRGDVADPDLLLLPRPSGLDGLHQLLLGLITRYLIDNETQCSLKSLERTVHEKSAYLEVLHKATRAANEATDCLEAVRVVLEHLAVTWRWHVAHARLTTLPGDVPADLWYPESMGQLARFMEQVAIGAPTRGCDLQQEVIEKAGPVWQEGPSVAGIFHTSVGFPVLVGREVAAVVTLHAMDARKPDPSLLDVLSQVGVQLGRCVERRRSREELKRRAFSDPLTGLPNRAAFLDRVQETLDHQLLGGGRFAVLFLDLDRFKVINDSLGHGFGDQLLKEVSARLRCHLKPEDTLARLGEDEFTILLPDVWQPGAAELVARDILEAIKAPFLLGTQEVFISASLGLALGEDPGVRPEDVLSDADAAMNAAKAQGRARFVRFEPEMRRRALVRLQTESALRRAIERQELRMHFQPIVHLADSTISGFEALVRWWHPKRGLIPPSEFIPVAEESGLIVAVGRWVMEETCRLAKAWTGPAARLPVSVNVAAAELSLRTFVRGVERILADTGLPPHRLQIEVTESGMMAQQEDLVEKFAALRALGVQIHIDDFGTGFSSLYRLHCLPFDRIKIDRSFVMRMGEAKDSVEFVRTIVGLARNLDKKVVAEGIETVEQLDLLKALDVDYGQGYYFARPVSSDDAQILAGRDPDD